MRVEHVTLRSGSIHCAADLYLPEAGAPAPGIAMGHSVTMVKEALRPHAEHLARAGYVVLALDYRTIGSSEGEPRGQWFPERQVEDIRAAVSYLRRCPEVEPERIGLWGHSTAAGVAIVAGALDRRIKSVVGQNPSMLDGWAALTTSLGRTKLRGIRALLERDVEIRYETGSGASIPALATDDPKLAGYIAQAERLFPTFVLTAHARALEPKQLELLPFDEFGLSIEPGLGQAMDLAVDFFDQHLHRAPLVVPSPPPAEAWSRGLRPEYRPR